MLILRYKYKDQDESKFAYTIHSEWWPKPGEVVVAKSRSAAPPGAKPTPVISADEVAVHNRSVIISGVSRDNRDTDLTEKFMDTLEHGEKSKVEKIELRKNNIMVATCVDWEACKLISEKYNKTKFLDGTVQIKRFADKNPAV